MYNLVKKQGKLNEFYLLAFFSVFCFALSLFRVSYTNSGVFFFLNWNLFLAFIPWCFSTLIILFPKLQQKKILIVLLLGIWLLFFPNAPYILTDLFHLKLQSNMPAWFDLALILSFAWTGLLYGFISLWNIEKIIAIKNKFLVSIATSMLLYIGSFGIYLGRYLRWNSWDMIQQPLNIVYDIGDRFINPLSHPRTWGVTLLLGTFLNMVYWSFKILKNKSEVK